MQFILLLFCKIAGKTALISLSAEFSDEKNILRFYQMHRNIIIILRLEDILNNERRWLPIAFHCRLNKISYRGNFAMKSLLLKNNDCIDLEISLLKICIEFYTFCEGLTNKLFGLFDDFKYFKKLIG